MGVESGIKMCSKCGPGHDTSECPNKGTPEELVGIEKDKKDMLSKIDSFINNISEQQEVDGDDAEACPHKIYPPSGCDECVNGAKTEAEAKKEGLIKELAILDAHILRKFETGGMEPEESDPRTLYKEQVNEKLSELQSSLEEIHRRFYNAGGDKFKNKKWEI